MSLQRVFDIFAALVTVAGVMVVVSSPNTSDIIRAWGDAFSQSTRAATGRS